MPGTFLECSFDNGPLHSCKDHVENNCTSFVLNYTRFCSHGADADVSPPGSHTVRIVASFGDDTVSYIISDTENDGEGLIIPCRDKFKMTYLSLSVRSSVPPLMVHFVNDSPRVVQDSVEAEFVTSRPVVGVTCFLRSPTDRSYEDCEF